MRFSFLIVAMSFVLLLAANVKKADVNNGKAVYNKICFACHKDGVAGAAALSNKKRWQENADKGDQSLLKTVKAGVVNGKYGTMPPKGSCMDCTDQDLYDAIHYMIKESGVKLK
jgi:cytochrome c5